MSTVRTNRVFEIVLPPPPLDALLRQRNEDRMLGGCEMRPDEPNHFHLRRTHATCRVSKLPTYAASVLPRMRW